MPRAKTEQLVALILYRCSGFTKDYVVPIFLIDIQERLLNDFGRRVTTKHIRRLIRRLKYKGIIERVCNYLNTGTKGHYAQANRYVVKDILRLFDLFVSDKDLETMTKAEKKKKAIKAGMPLDCFKPGYTPSDAYIENYSPFYRAATQGDLGPKYPSGDPRNYERQKRVNTIMIKLKRELQQGEKDALV